MLDDEKMEVIKLYVLVSFHFIIFQLAVNWRITNIYIFKSIEK